MKIDPDPAEPAASVQALRSVGRSLLGQPRLLAWILPAAWATAIVLLSSLEGSDSPANAWELGGFTANLGHPAVFGILALLLVPLAPRRDGVQGGRWTGLAAAGALWIVVAVGLFGFTDELHQSTVEGRDASLFDLLADVVGAIAVITVVIYLGRSDADGPGLRRRLGAGLAASVAAAGIGTLWGRFQGTGLWPF